MVRKKILLVFLSIPALFLSSYIIGASSSHSMLADKPQAEDPTLLLNGADLGTYGPLSIGATYSDQFSWIVNTKYLQALGEHNAIGLEMDAGPDENRQAATWGLAFTPFQRIKITGERLEQNMPFSFITGDIRHRVPQYAGGGAYQFLFANNTFFQDVSVGGYYSQATSQDLSTVSFIQDGTTYLNYRKIVGARAAGGNIATDFYPWPNSIATLAINYDNVNYPTQYVVTNFDTNKSELGVSAQLKQLLFHDHAQIQLFASHRAIYDEYGGGVGMLARVSPDSTLSVGVNGMHIQNHNAQPDDNRVTLDLGLTWGQSGVPATFTNPQVAATDIRSWTNDPAVHMDAVLAAAEQAQTVAYPLKANGFTPAQLSVFSANNFSSQANFVGENLKYTFRTAISNAGETNGLPCWAHFDSSSQTLSGTAPAVSQTTSYVFYVTATNSFGSVTSIFTLVISPNNNAIMTQQLKNDIPIIMTITNDKIINGSYITTPPGSLINTGNFKIDSLGSGKILGYFTYKAEGSDAKFNGLGCRVKYEAHNNGQGKMVISETAQPFSNANYKTLCNVVTQNDQSILLDITTVEK